MDSNKLMDFIEKSTRPSSIFAKSILRENISSQVVHLFTPISFILYLILKHTYMFHETSETTPVRINAGPLTYHYCTRIANFLFITSIVATIFLYKYKSPIYVSYINYFQSSIKKNPFGLKQISYVNKWQKINRAIVILQSLTRLIIFTFELYVNPFSQPYNYVDTLWYMSELCFILEQQFIYETCIYLQSNFIFFTLFFDSLLKEVNESVGLDVYQAIKSARYMHTRAIEFTRQIDSFFRLTVLNTFGLLTVYSICIIGMLLTPDQTMIRVLGLIGRAIFIATILCVSGYHFARVNYLSIQVFKKVHDLSLSPNLVRSIETINEINLFLLRISRDDIGFTLAGLCVVSVNFISSLAIVSLTIGVALPGFFK